MRNLKPIIYLKTKKVVLIQINLPLSLIFVNKQYFLFLQDAAIPSESVFKAPPITSFGPLQEVYGKKILQNLFKFSVF